MTDQNKNKKPELSDLDKEVIKRIQELIPKAPDLWKKTIAKTMGGKSIESINKYIDGTRGISKGYHKEVLRILKILVEKEDERINKLLS